MCDLRYHRTHNTTLEFLRGYLENIQHVFDHNCIFQFCLASVCGNPLDKIRLLFIDTSHYDVGVSDING